MRELVELFLTDVPVRLANLQQAVANGSALEIKNEAHGLKGSCGNLAATGLHRQMAEMEKYAAAGELTMMPNLMQSADAEFERVQSFFEEVLGGR